MNTYLDPVDTHLMLTNSDPNANTRLVLDMQYKVEQEQKENPHRSDAD